jgi:hypothetical protein
LLHLSRGRHDEDHHRRGVPLLDLGGAVDLDLEDEVVAGGNLLAGRAVPLVVAGEVGVLEEAVLGDLLPESGLVDEDVGVLRLPRPAGARRPRA